MFWRTWKHGYHSNPSDHRMSLLGSLEDSGDARVMLIVLDSPPASENCPFRNLRRQICLGIQIVV